MLERLGGTVVRRRGVVGGVTGGLLGVGRRFGAGDANLVLVVTAQDGTVDDPAVASAGQALTARLAADHQIAYAASYWTVGGPPLRSTNGNRALVLARI